MLSKNKTPGPQFFCACVVWFPYLLVLPFNLAIIQRTGTTLKSISREARKKIPACAVRISNSGTSFGGRIWNYFNKFERTYQVLIDRSC